MYLFFYKTPKVQKEPHLFWVVFFCFRTGKGGGKALTHRGKPGFTR